MYRVLVADDERIARNIVTMLLKDQDDIAEIVEARNGNEALELARQVKPHIVFLDIQMPGQTGIQLAAHLPEDCVVIFVTAYDEYAVNAFELCALDYLLKPFEDERFYTSLARARRQLKEKTQPDHKQLSDMLVYALDEQKQTFRSRLVVKEPGRIRLVDVQDINFIAGAGNYAEVHLFDGSEILHRETLSTLETQLDPSEFVRIHRSTIIRRSCIEELRPSSKGDYLVTLKSGDSMTLSRRHKAKLSELFR